MKPSQVLALSPRLLWREWRSGELSILLLALVVAIGSHTAIGHFADRVSRGMTINAQHVIGGDLVMSSSRPFDPAVREAAARLDIETASTQRFFTVAGTGEDILLVSVKSVGDSYPLKGSLRVTRELYGAEEAVQSGPGRGEAWVEARVLHALGIELGQEITIGESGFRLSRVLTYEPDRGNNFYSFNPRVMINQADLEETGVIQPGSRVWYRDLFAGDAVQVSRFRAWLEPRLNPGEHIRNLDEDRPALSEALDKAKQYTGLASLVALLLAAVAVANSGRHYSERHYDTSALLRCLGCSQNDILGIYVLQLLLLALAGGILGNLVGWLSQAGLIMVLGSLLPENIPGIGIEPVLSGMFLGFVVLLGFTLPSVLRLRAVPPQRVLRKDLTPLSLSARLVYGVTLTLIVTLMWIYTGNLVLTLGMTGGSVVVIAVAALGIVGIFRLLARSLPLIPVQVRAGVRNFLRRRRETVAQTMAFGLTIMAMLVVLMLRTELITTWQETVPEDAPNHFVLNIQVHETEPWAEFTAGREIDAGPLYQVVRGRLIRINGTPVRDHVSKEEREDESINRELNLTWSEELPTDNRLTAGRWWQAGDRGHTRVSVEDELAERLGIAIGDELTFFTGDRNWTAEVVSLRRVKWDNFNPNFYMVFNPGALDALPASWIGSFFLEPERKKLLVDMMRSFPSITLLEVDAVLRQVKTIIGQVILAVESILLFVLVAGFVVTLSAIHTSMNERLQEGALVRTLGAGRGLLHINQWSEFASMGLLAGLIGVLGAELVIAVLYWRIFELEYSPTWWAWALVPPLSALLIGLAGIWSSRRILAQPPIRILREAGA